MIEKKVTVKRKSGLQARPAALFVQEANKFNADIFIAMDGKNVNAKSIMGLMSLAVSADKEITLKADGADAEEALAALTAFVERDE
ncbi:HPr family phosphocarrier protein [Salisediminibacterium halotolerans]|uniref:Catabolite repression HPr-like protein n=1 Tax=Salisediminibacterium halotolerans TaxID=517425 RepID=A0A1H9W0T8_9BACI|nr:MULTISPECIES: HPr family phosphocarrier protein [Salisediminibacterium]RLJ75446.1 catabolite repression HPr-like protein [Actinophytocola xinjiangensis]RPE89299.1 catabolite repression HPr-like protein [Salisediminibacterium halotolerans]TWG36059.1 catabolite repression HPr-like protein [Salisediminibacterium halotolerans]SES27361.1 catabolite repression HPr-like protein [Salisediminibacterium haloalkalitolerans]GEL07822.1 phosphocarrier protein HPr [Salisediminibacterium halotolerans]